MVDLDLAERRSSCRRSRPRSSRASAASARPRVRLVLADDVEITAEHVGLRVLWAAASGLAAQLEAPSLSLDVQGEVLPISSPVVGDDGSVTLPAEGWDAIQALVGELGALFPRRRRRRR